ncbi:MAG: hypothetical protein DMF82_07340 [Acidobacteria bacterium]|nr:MAG: hypothetical protein DMF82_07340 [Acidobacteriota bacterium]
MKCGAFIPLYVAALLIAVGCRTAVDPPAAPAAAPAPPLETPAPPPAAPAPPPVAPAPAPAAPSEAVSFEASIKPLLARTCTPCHVPGGRMYERLPFDQPEVVLSHKDGVLRRMKDPDNRQLMERWFAENGKS